MYEGEEEQRMSENYSIYSIHMTGFECLRTKPNCVKNMFFIGKRFECCLNNNECVNVKNQNECWNSKVCRNDVNVILVKVWTRMLSIERVVFLRWFAVFTFSAGCYAQVYACQDIVIRKVHKDIWYYDVLAYWEESSYSAVIPETSGGIYDDVWKYYSSFLVSVSIIFFL